MQAFFLKEKCNFSLTNEDTVRIIDSVKNTYRIWCGLTHEIV